MPTEKTRRATTITCPRCGSRVIRAELRGGDVVHADPIALSSAGELRAHANGLSTYRAQWRAGMQLARRTAHLIRTTPTAPEGSRIYKEHRCTTPPPATPATRED